ncbi:hypothetical protein [Trichormus azollae]|uniref:hypothetical protein n=1 Tax=Trichormus azollae TaxID=1164 RepID=UPI00325F5465
MRDITEPEKLQVAVKQSQEGFRKLTEKVCVIPWEADYKTGNFIYFGNQSEDILAYSLMDWYTTDFLVKHIHPDESKMGDLLLSPCFTITRQL